MQSGCLKPAILSVIGEDEGIVRGSGPHRGGEDGDDGVRTGEGFRRERSSQGEGGFILHAAIRISQTFKERLPVGARNQIAPPVVCDRAAMASRTSAVFFVSIASARTC